MKGTLTFERFGPHAILVNWPSKIDPNIHGYVLNFEKYIWNNHGEDIIETVPAYHSLAVYLKRHIDSEEFIVTLKIGYPNESEHTAQDARLFTVPVCYHKQFALDFKTVEAHCQIDFSEFIKLHTANLYTVFFLGFLPGFPYLGGLNKKLEISRLTKPREKVSRGSVAIGGSQTGIYPSASPGGWNIVGRTPLELFNIKNMEKPLFQPGDQIRFKAISKKEFSSLERKIENGMYKIEIHD